MYLLTAIAGEVSIFGESLGGYASCYAAASRPSQFKRAMCISPSFWWNYGSLSTQIPQLHAQHKESPTAVVMTLESQESPQLYVPANYPNNTSKDKITWAQFVAQVTAAFISIGMGSSKQINESSYYPSADSNLVSIDYIGDFRIVYICVVCVYVCIHVCVCGTSRQIVKMVSFPCVCIRWGAQCDAVGCDVFSYGLSLMYAPDFPDQTRLQRNQATVWNYPPIVVASNSSAASSAVCSCPINTDNYTQTLIIILSLLLAVATLLLVVAGGYICFHLRDKKEKPPLFYEFSSTPLLMNNENN